MAGSFFASFNAALPALEASFSEDWSFKDTVYPAIAIDHEVDSAKMMKGGEFDDATVTIHIRLEVFLLAGCLEGDIVTARGKEFAILSIESDGDDARALVCGPAQIDVWEK
jgi:hypothetical protein